MSGNPVHLGDGAYATATEYGELILTANHHEQSQATDVIHLDEYAVNELIRYAKEQGVIQ